MGIVDLVLGKSLPYLNLSFYPSGWSPGPAPCLGSLGGTEEIRQHRCDCALQTLKSARREGKGFVKRGRLERSRDPLAGNWSLSSESCRAYLLGRGEELSWYPHCGDRALLETEGARQETVSFRSSHVGAEEEGGQKIQAWPQNHLFLLLQPIPCASRGLWAEVPPVASPVTFMPRLAGTGSP